MGMTIDLRLSHLDHRKVRQGKVWQQTGQYGMDGVTSGQVGERRFHFHIKGQTLWL